MIHTDLTMKRLRLVPLLAAFILMAGYRRNWLRVIAGGLPWVLIVAHFHWSAFGAPWSTPYSHLENPGFVSGGNLRWWRDHFFGPDSEYDAICRPAADVAPGAEGLVFLPCMQGAMAPEWNGAARGVFFG